MRRNQTAGRAQGGEELAKLALEPGRPSKRSHGVTISEIGINRNPVLMRGRSTVLEFDEVFAEDEDGNWAALLTVVFFAPDDPYTAFDYVELSRFELVMAGLAP